MRNEKITFAAVVAEISHASWRVNLAVTQISPHFQNSLVRPHSVFRHQRGIHIIRWCSLTCSTTPNLIILTNKYIIALTSWVLKTCVLAPLFGSLWSFWGKRMKFWKERSLSLLLNYKFPSRNKWFDAEMRELQTIKRPAVFLDFATSPFFRSCRGLKCLTEWGRRRLVPNL
jgi:hypothetical protein